MKNRKRFIQAVCILLTVLMLLSITVMVVAPSAYAASSDQIQLEIEALNSQQSEIQSRMIELQAQIDSLDYEKANTLEKKAILDQKNMLAQEELDVIQEQIDIIDGKIASIQTDLETARADEELQRELWLARLRAMEESSDVGYLEVLFDASSFSDLLTRLDMVNEVMAYDEALESQYIEARQKVETLEAQAGVMLQENDARRQELQAKKNTLEADIAAACLLIQQMEQDSADYAEVLDQEAQTQAMVQALIVQKEQEFQRAKAAEEAARRAAIAAQQAAAQQAAAQQAAQAQTGTETGTESGVSDSSATDAGSVETGEGNGGDAEAESGDSGSDGESSDTGDAGMDSGSSQGSSNTSGTWMLWPSYTNHLTDEYGMRTNPVSGEYKKHAGVDVGASYGSSIYSAAGGTVIFAGENGGYGNCVIVNHGNGYTTLYGHMSSINVSTGETVSQGETLGKVGSTGNSTGPHLHFEVRSSSSGESMDPEGFSYF